MECAQNLLPPTKDVDEDIIKETHKEGISASLQLKNMLPKK